MTISKIEVMMQELWKQFFETEHIQHTHYFKVNEIHNISHFNAVYFDRFNNRYNLESKKELIG